MSKFTSRKFLMALFDALFIILNEGLELGIPQDVYLWITAIIITYIAGEAAVDVARK